MVLGRLRSPTPCPSSHFHFRRPPCWPACGKHATKKHFTFFLMRRLIATFCILVRSALRRPMFRPRLWLPSASGASSLCRSRMIRALVVGDGVRQLMGGAKTQNFAPQLERVPASSVWLERAHRQGSEALPSVLRRAAAEVNSRALILSVDATGALEHVSGQAMLAGMLARLPLPYGSSLDITLALGLPGYSTYKPRQCTAP